MTNNEIDSYIKVGSKKSICVDRQLIKKYLGYVRDLIIMNDFILKVEFNTYGYDEGGLIIKVYFNDFDSLIKSAEEYIGSTINDWDNISKTGWYPVLEEEVDFKESGLKLKHDYINEFLYLPKDGVKYEIPDGYWKRLKD